MPIFEIEKDGQLFELEAPDMQSAAGALSRYTPKKEPEEEWSVGGFIGNAASDIGDIATGVATAVAHPIDTAKAIYENPTALAQPYIDQASDPVGYGYKQPVSSLLNISGLAGVGRGALVQGGKMAANAGRKTASISKMNQAQKLNEAADVAGKVSRYTDPFLAAGKFVSQAGRGAFQKAALPAAGAFSATGQSPVRAFEAGREGGQKATYLKGHMRDLRSADEADALINKGVDEAFQGAQSDINELYSGTRNPSAPPQPGSLMADKTPMWTFDKELPDILKEARETALYSGEPRNAVVSGVYRQIEDIMKTWIEPPSKILAARKAGKGGDLATQSVSAKMVEDFGGDPATTTVNDFVKLWIDKRRTFEGMDALKQRLSTVYEGYAAEKGVGNARAKKLETQVVKRIQKIIDDETAPRHGTKYADGQKIWSERMRLVKNFRDTFGYKKDTVSRRITAINRDGAFADFGNRLKELREMQAIAPSMRDIEFIGAGRHMKTWQPRNLMMGAGGLLGLGYLMNPGAGVLALALHLPRGVGEAAYGIGKMTSWIERPLKSVAKAVNNTSKKYNLGVTPGGLVRGTAQGLAQTGKAAQLEQTRESFRNDLLEHAQKTGVKIHPRILNKIADQIITEDPDEFMDGLKTVSGHKRLMSLINSMGTKGEQ